MKQNYTTWVAISLVISAVVIVAIIIFIKGNKSNLDNTTTTPTPVGSASLESSATTTVSTSPTSSVSPTPIGSNEDQAKAAYQRKDYATAIIKYNAAISESSDAKKKAELYNSLGNSYRDNKNYTQAIDIYKKAYGLDPKLVVSYINLSNIYIGQNQDSKAKEVLEAGLKANPGNTELERELSVVNLGGTDAAE